VRAADVYVDELDLVNLGFEGAIPADDGRPAYHPSFYCVELVWLTGRLMPDFQDQRQF
jgi:hypothetical protein